MTKEEAILLIKNKAIEHYPDFVYEDSVFQLYEPIILAIIDEIESINNKKNGSIIKNDKTQVLS
jgi:hypothetical protein